MTELTTEDREQIQNQITEYKAQQLTEANPVQVPVTPDGTDATQTMNKAFSDQSTPDKREDRRIKRRIKGIWHNWRTTALDAKSLEIEKIACKIAIERAEARAKINEIRRAEEVAETKHWLALNKGNLIDIGANTESRPHKVWYGIRRFCHHVTKITDNIPRVFRNICLIGVAILVLVILKNLHVL